MRTFLLLGWVMSLCIVIFQISLGGEAVGTFLALEIEFVVGWLIMVGEAIGQSEIPFAMHIVVRFNIILNLLIG